MEMRSRATRSSAAQCCVELLCPCWFHVHNDDFFEMDRLIRRDSTACGVPVHASFAVDMERNELGDTSAK
jgi:chloramphenicol 3-O-phosphotransferase